MRTPDNSPVTLSHATIPVGSALRVVPTFVATTVDDGPVQTAIEARFHADAGRYLVAAVTNRASEDRGEITGTVLRTVRIAEIMQAATPHCIAIESDAGASTVGELTTRQDAILPPEYAKLARRLGPKQDTLELVRLVYGVAALTGRPPTKAVEDEFSIPRRTAIHWISKTRDAGLLDGISYAVGRQADG